MINKEGGIETMDLNKLKEIQAVVFDMDGLMFDSERYVQKSWDIAGERLGYGPLGHNIVNTLGTNLTNRKKYFLEHYGNDFPFDKFLDGYRDAYYELVEDGVPAKKGLHEILKVLREKGLKIGVATSSSEEHAVSNLKREGIFDYFDSVITGNMIEHGKPEPDIYIEACRQLKVDPSKAIALEDAINGIRSAHGAGMNPVMIPDIVQDTSKVDDILFGIFAGICRDFTGRNIRYRRNTKIRREYMAKKKSAGCEYCSNYVYDEDYEYYVCDINLDEDEMARFMSYSDWDCPYFQMDDEYAIVRKQN